MGWLAQNISLMLKESILFDYDEPERDSDGNILIDVAYRRVSTEKQSTDGFGLDAQLKDIKDYYRRYNENVPVLLITENGFTGTTMDRPGLNCFKKRLNDFNIGATNIRIRKFVVPKIDRLGRTLVGTLSFIQEYLLPSDDCEDININKNKNKNNKKSKNKKKLDYYGEHINNNRYCIEFVSIQETVVEIKLDKYGKMQPNSKLMLNILSVFAEFDRDQIVLKMKGGKEQRAALGYPLGGGGIPYGYYYDKDKDLYGNYVTIPEQKEKFLEARRLFVEEHMAPNKIADKLGFKTEQLVINMLKRRTYLNVVTYNGKEYPGHFEAFITEEQWQEQQDEFASRAKGSNYSRYLLTSLLFCGNCGSKLRYQSASNGNTKIYCYSQDNSASKRHIVKDENCPNHTRYPAKDVEDVVIKTIMSLSFKTDENNKKSISVFDIKENLKNEIAKLQAKLSRLVEKYATADSTSPMGEAIEAQMEQTSEEIEQLRMELDNTIAQETRARKANKILYTIKTFKDAWEHMTLEERREVCMEIIESVIITETGGKPSIQVNLQLQQYLNLREE